MLGIQPATPTALPNPDTEADLLSALSALLADLAGDAPAAQLVAHFSTLHEPQIQHAPAACPLAQRGLSRLRGLNAVRSYFDLLATHFERAGVAEVRRMWADPTRRAATAQVETKWRWRASGRKFEEELDMELVFDEQMKIVSFVVATTGGTCMMNAVDVEVAPLRSAPAVDVQTK
ncbi:hypothetical protein BD626DRAFT_127019 [Schizophyllum amplum]|uniref:SnoaL-like domain-containing protein n=1 Tax=Schizophyllum amplum TaxID=97359 RepID=A0A550C729_9AGAR|nr:hypothetical protein BD626DRAFT_127019 [Auriculariopsis ampla]